MSTDKNNIQLGESAGAGWIGNSYLGEYNGTKVLVMPLKKSSFSLRLDLSRRFALSTKLNSPYLSESFGVLHVNGDPCWVTRWEEGTRLSELIASGEPMSITGAANVGRQISQALQGALSKNIVHGDLHPSQVFLRPDGSVLIDGFGRTPSTHFSSNARTAPKSYWAPEKVSSGSSDIYGLGIILAELLIADEISIAKDAPEQHDNIVAALTKELAQIHGESDIVDTIGDMLTFDSAQRISASSVFHRLNNVTPSAVPAASPAVENPVAEEPVVEEPAEEPVEEPVEENPLQVANDDEFNDDFFNDYATPSVVEEDSDEDVEADFNEEFGIDEMELLDTPSADIDEEDFNEDFFEDYRNFVENPPEEDSVEENYNEDFGLSADQLEENSIIEGEEVSYGDDFEDIFSDVPNELTVPESEQYAVNEFFSEDVSSEDVFFEEESEDEDEFSSSPAATVPLPNNDSQEESFDEDFDQYEDDLGEEFDDQFAVQSDPESSFFADEDENDYESETDYEKVEESFDDSDDGIASQEDEYEASEEVSADRMVLDDYQSEEEPEEENFEYEEEDFGLDEFESNDVYEQGYSPDDAHQELIGQTETPDAAVAEDEFVEPPLALENENKQVRRRAAVTSFFDDEPADTGVNYQSSDETPEAEEEVAKWRKPVIISAVGLAATLLVWAVINVFQASPPASQPTADATTDEQQLASQEKEVEPENENQDDEIQDVLAESGDDVATEDDSQPVESQPKANATPKKKKRQRNAQRASKKKNQGNAKASRTKTQTRNQATTQTRSQTRTPETREEQPEYRFTQPDSDDVKTIKSSEKQEVVEGESKDAGALMWGAGRQEEVVESPKQDTIVAPDSSTSTSAEQAATSGNQQSKEQATPAKTGTLKFVGDTEGVKITVRKDGKSFAPGKLEVGTYKVTYKFTGGKSHNTRPIVIEANKTVEIKCSRSFMRCQ